MTQGLGMHLIGAVARDVARHPELGAYDIVARPGGVVAVAPYPGVGGTAGPLALLRRLGYRAWLGEGASGEWIAVLGRSGARWFSLEEQLRPAAGRRAVGAIPTRRARADPRGRPASPRRRGMTRHNRV